jgi:uncharacterized protein YecT (DUF1311 family)
MTYLRHILGAVVLIAAAGSALAVQDPKASAAQLDSRIAIIEGELSKVDKQLANTKLAVNERQALQSKRASLAKEQRALAKDRARNDKLSENPMVVYGHDAPASTGADRVDGLFK